MDMKNLPGEAELHEATKEQLYADFKTVIADAEALIRATAGQSGEALASARTKVEASLASAKAKMADAEAAVIARAKAAAKATDVYVHENPWKSIGITAGLGVLIGFLMGRR
jgi:ElaB/YqjD/DUF883 family membrane-anchored ribosome-binding protein